MYTRPPHAEPPATARAKIGQILRGKWRLDALLGAGGMATVYAATHRNGKRGAVKILHRELAVDENARTRFLQEGYAANKVNHPGAVSVLDDDVDDDGSVFLVMELLDGQSADARAQQRPGERLEVHEVAQLADQLLDVLAAAHDKGIVHRDIKPENIFLTRDGALKVLDFGIARIRETSASAGTNLTANGGPMGTPAFMPPEQALGNWDDVGPRTDLWAVGATMFTLLSGQCVHSATTLNQLLLAAMTKPAPPIGTVVPGVPVALAAVIDHALAFNANQRWPDARAMQRALRSIPREQLAAAPSVKTTLQSVGVTRPPRGQSGGSVPGVSTVSPISSDRPTQRRPVGSQLARYGLPAVVVAVAGAIGSFLLLRHGTAVSPNPDASLASPTSTTSPAVNGVGAPGTTSPPVVAPAPPVVVVPTVEPSASLPVASARPAASAAQGKPGKGGPGALPTPIVVKTAKPKDPLDKF